MCSNLNTSATVTLLLTLRILEHIEHISYLAQLNIFHILRKIKYAKMRAFYWNKEKSSEVFFLPDINIRPPPPPRNESLRLESK